MAFNPAISSLLSISFLFSLFILANSQCSELTSNGSTACELDGYCSWNTDSNCVCGQTSWDQDIAFIFDSSMAELDWFYTTKFAAELLYYGSPSDTTTRAAIITTGTSTIDPTVDLSFADNEALSDTITTTLPDLSQVTQADLYLEEALQSALDLFNASSSSSTRKILIVFASELFSQASIPCRVNTRKHEVYTYTITMGSWDPYAFLCVGSSENNYEGLQSVSDASQLTDVLLPVLEAITCPHHPLVKVTEIQLEGALGEQYFEIYNYGHDITDMSQIELSGIASGALSAGATLSQGAIGVIYNTDAAIAKAAVPDCATCSCVEDTNTVSEASIKWCDSAVYYGCCSDCSDNYAAFENIVSSCVWDTGLSMASFDLELVWTNAITNTQFTLNSLTVNTTEQMPTMETNYALELINKGYNNKFVSSWSMSCDADGTPGDDYLNVECGYDCTTDGNKTCDLNGGMWLDLADPVPGCVFSAQSCNCLAGFYPHYRTCLRLPTPISCLDVQVTTAVSDVSFIVAEWDGDTRYTYSHCEEVDGCLGSIVYSISTVNSLRFRIHSPGRSTNNTRISLSAISPHDDSYEWLGFDIKCNPTTADPTMSPTPSPTFSVPTVPSCTITIAADMKNFVITWDPIDMLQFNETAADMEHFAGYVYYFNTFRRNGAAPASCCNVSGLVPNSATFDLSSDTIHVSGDWDSTLTDVDQGKEYTSATLCSAITQVPTSSPSKSPSDEPTPGPTEVPSAAPTLSPTQKELYIASCAAVVLPGGTSLSMSWNAAEFGSDTASINDTQYIIEWFYSNGRTPGFEMIPANQGVRGIDVVDYLNVTNLQMHCVWDSWTQIGRKTNCTITTYAPSKAQSNAPSKAPSQNPSASPMTSVSSAWIVASTQSPKAIIDSPVAVYSDDIYFLDGAYNNGYFQKEVLKYSIANDAFTQLGVLYNESTTSLYALGIYDRYTPSYYSQSEHLLYSVDLMERLDVYDMQTMLLTTDFISLPDGINEWGCLVSTPLYLFTIGVGSSDLSGVLMLDLTASTLDWVAVPSMNSERREFSCIMDNNDMMYAIGGNNGMGYDASSLLSSIERISINSIQSQSWQYITDNLSQSTRNTRSVLHNEFIYVIGGKTDQGSTILDIVHVIDTTTDSVSLLSDTLPYTVALPSTLIFNGVLYVFGGNDGIQWCYTNTLLSDSSGEPTTYPTAEPTGSPTLELTPLPTASPSRYPTVFGVNDPTREPTDGATIPTPDPTRSPLKFGETNYPTKSPTRTPTEIPSKAPTAEATLTPIAPPSVTPTINPTEGFTTNPSLIPTRHPSESPTTDPTDTNNPTKAPTEDVLGSSACFNDVSILLSVLLCLVVFCF